jgi:hypothetical protein
MGTHDFRAVVARADMLVGRDAEWGLEQKILDNKHGMVITNLISLGSISEWVKLGLK